MKHAISACAATAAILFSAPASAVAITGLYNTGAGFAAGSKDTHYTLAVTSGSTVLTSANPYVTTDNVWPVNPWLANTAASKWLTPSADQAQSYDPSQDGLYKYSLTFSLAGYNVSSASFAGRFAADNAAQVYLNGSLLGSSGGFDSWATFTAASGFVAGLNTVEFVVRNYANASGNPTGLRAEFTSSSVSAVPEPASAALFMTGLGLMGFLARRRKGIASAA